MIKRIVARLMAQDRKRLIAGTVVLAAVAGTAVWFLWPAPEADAPKAEAAAAHEEAQLPPVTVTQVRATRIAPQASYPGTVMSRNDSRIAADVEGRVDWVADVGTVVAAGDVIARLDPNVARMENDSAQANVARLAAQVRFDRAQAQRLQELHERKVVSKAAVDQANSTRDANEAALKQAEASAKRSAFRLERSEIRAPFAGRVVSRLINAGEYASPGKEIVRLVDQDAIEIATQVPIAAMAFLREGMSVTVELQGKHVETPVRVIVPVGDAQSRTVEVRLALQAGSAFVADAVKVMIPTAEPRKVLAVPRDALVLREENTYLFKLSGENKAERIAVEMGAADGDLVEVTGMLKEGERVIIRGAEQIESGQKVRLVT
ncbi:MAG: efflux RND transporter periplasmic adaptor subunit [Alphaproteobacteria bacterium]|nr:efflux RND transporter periplasmic adaptor subunit [Alphaproteobacteria bacterium]